MAMIWIDGFDAYNTNNVDITTQLQTSGYTTRSSSIFNPQPATSNNTRDGIGFSVNPNAAGHGGYPCGIVRNFNLATEIVFGFAYYFTDQSFNAICQVCYNDGVGNFHYLVKIFANMEGGITAEVGYPQPNTDPGVADGQNGPIGISPPNVLFANTWQYIEVRCQPFVGGGTFKLKVDGVMVINNTTLSTSYSWPLTPFPVHLNYCNALAFVNDNPGYGFQLIDDLYICDTTGSSFNDFLGDVVVRAVFPKDDAGPNTFTQVGGGSGHFTAVDAQTPNDGTSYLTSASSGAKELFDLNTFPSDVIDVLAVAVNCRASKTTAGYSFFEPITKYSTTEADGPSQAVSQSYQTFQYCFQTAPDGSPWTTNTAQNTQIGFKIP